jgi:cell division transport system permease protein
MGGKLFKKKYQYDIALDEGSGAHLVTWVTGLMVFFVTLTLAVNLGLNTVTQNWVSGLSGSLTVEISPPLPAADAGKITPEQIKTFDDNVQKVLTVAGQTPGVTESRALGKDEIRKLIQPWLGDNVPKAMPLPALIDIKLSVDADTRKIQDALLKAVPDATVDTHAGTLDDVKTLVGTARLFVLLLTGVITLLAVAAISGIVRAKLAIHAQEVQTLHMIGASDEYIARQFRHHTLKGTLRGAILGVTCMVLTLMGIRAMTHSVDATIMPHIHLSPLQWGFLVLAPVLTGSLVAHITAQRTVMRELVKLP